MSQNTLCGPLRAHFCSKMIILDISGPSRGSFWVPKGPRRVPNDRKRAPEIIFSFPNGPEMNPWEPLLGPKIAFRTPWAPKMFDFVDLVIFGVDFCCFETLFGIILGSLGELSGAQNGPKGPPDDPRSTPDQSPKGFWGTALGPAFLRGFRDAPLKNTFFHPFLRPTKTAL